MNSLIDGDEDNFDAATEINEAMISSLAEVVSSVSIDENKEYYSTNTELSEGEIVTSEAIITEETPDTTVDDLVSEGETAHRAGDYDNALELFNKAIALDPSNAMAWFNRGVLLESKQDPKGAKQSFVICLDIDPNHGPALANLAVLLDRLGDNDGSVEIANRALEFFPAHPYLVKILDDNRRAGGIIQDSPKILPHTQENFVNQNLTHAISEDVEDLFENEIQNKEIEEYESPIPEVTTDIDIDSICNESLILLTQGDAKGALQLLKPYLHAEASDNYEAWKIAAGAMASLSLDDHAIGAYNHALGLNSEDAKSFFNLGALHERKENFDAASKCFKSALNIDSNYLKAATRLVNISNRLNDVEGLLTGTKILATQEEHRLEYAELLIQLSEGESYILENTNGLPPTIPEGPSLAKEAMNYCEQVSTLMARAQSAAGEHTESVKTWKLMIQSDKTNPELWYGLAKSLENAGDVGSSQRCREKAQSLMSKPEEMPDEVEPKIEGKQGLVSAVPLPSNQSVPLPEVSTTQELHEPEPVPTPIVSQLPEITAPTPKVEEKPQPKPEVDLAAAALEATANMERSRNVESNSNSIANQDIEWYNKGVALIEDKKFREALSCFDRALPSFANNDEMVIRILNGRGNALYYLEDYPKCVESYHKAMVINPKGVQGKTLYNMGTAYAEMQRFTDAIKCFDQSIPRGLDKNQQKLAKEQIRRCNILLKEQQRKMN